MGQAPSMPELSPEWSEILPSITREDIVRSSKRKCRITENRSVYIDDDLFDLDEHVPVALAILRAHPHLKDLRFKLVPGRMPEEKFWAAVFSILNDGRDETMTESDYDDVDDQEGVDNPDPGDTTCLEEKDENKVIQDDDDDDGNDDADKKHQEETEILLAYKVRPPLEKKIQKRSDLPDDVRNAVSAYRGLLVEHETIISNLQRRLREANHKIRTLGLELHKERNTKQAMIPPSEETKGDNDHRAHTGKWELHPDSKEFLKLDEQLKDNLRKEKEKRMKEVTAQLKFILVSDDLKDSYGKWSCCGNEEYESNGCVLAR